MGVPRAARSVGAARRQEADHETPGGLDLRLTFGDLLLKFEGELGPESRADTDLASLYQEATQG